MTPNAILVQRPLIVGDLRFDVGIKDFVIQLSFSFKSLPRKFLLTISPLPLRPSDAAEAPHTARDIV